MPLSNIILIGCGFYVAFFQYTKRSIAEGLIVPRIPPSYGQIGPEGMHCTDHWVS